MPIMIGPELIQPPGKHLFGQELLQHLLSGGCGRSLDFYYRVRESELERLECGKWVRCETPLNQFNWAGLITCKEPG